jgi:heme exporter protein B
VPVNYRAAISLQSRRLSRKQMMDYFSTVWVIFKKDLMTERRSREIVSSMLLFALIAILILIFSFELAVNIHQEAFAGTVWVAICFAGTLGLNRLMNQERENQCLDALLLAPVDRTALYLGKVLANWAFMLLLAAILIPVAGFFYSLNPFRWGLIGVVLLGTLGYSLAGTLISAIAAKLSNREMYLPVLLFPVVIPLLMAAVRATNLLLTNGAASELGTWVLMLGGFDLLILAVGILLFDQIIGD